MDSDSIAEALDSHLESALNSGTTSEWGRDPDSSVLGLENRTKTWAMREATRLATILGAGKRRQKQDNRDMSPYPEDDHGPRSHHRSQHKSRPRNASPYFFEDDHGPRWYRHSQNKARPRNASPYFFEDDHRSRSHQHSQNKSRPRDVSPYPADDHGSRSHRHSQNGSRSYNRSQREHPICDLRCMDWDDFSSFKSDRGLASFVIDILIGEPTVRRPSHRHVFRNHLINTNELRDSHSESSVNYSGQTQLPERIRIHSMELISVLRRTRGIPPKLFRDTSSDELTMLRPYCFLTFYSDAIRDMHQELIGVKSGMRRALQHSNASSASRVRSTDAVPPSPRDPLCSPDSPAAKMPLLPDRITLEIEHTECIIRFMDDYISKRVSWLHSARCQRIYFTDIWHLYQPGDLVVSTNGKQAYQVVSVYTGAHHGHNLEKDVYYGTGDQDAAIYCVSVHYDGISFGPVTTSFVIKRFDGLRLISNMEVIPLRHFRSPDLVRTLAGLTDDEKGHEAAEAAVRSETEAFRARLIERGRRCVDAMGIKHMYYAGWTVDRRDEVEGEVMIDTQEALSDFVKPNNVPKFANLLGHRMDVAILDSRCTANCCWDQEVLDEGIVQRMANDSFFPRAWNGDGKKTYNSTDAEKPTSPIPVTLLPRELAEITADPSLLRDIDLMIMSYSVYGYFLRDRSWGKHKH
ncbi:uncharacterized protein SPSK_02318 [Sporothrix schenckii 1099-18]|uniref:DUF7025 domain-containing protein n=1 Tax=Sporothrix schenckii 1099-18 TaxID=1397361 RepID=A0A0F2M9G0_SPOSC|nr:uncharacterized protein SPSK_02318 [Sporothrix schenckii 1099-18]KJR86282.1 hypothetical protein SPSK_02318 [Sporothrix schenckii 1099-18]